MKIINSQIQRVRCILNTRNIYWEHLKTHSILIVKTKGRYKTSTLGRENAAHRAAKTRAALGVTSETIWVSRQQSGTVEMWGFPPGISISQNQGWAQRNIIRRWTVTKGLGYSARRESCPALHCPARPDPDISYPILYYIYLLCAEPEVQSPTPHQWCV